MVQRGFPEFSAVLATVLLAFGVAEASPGSEAPGQARRRIVQWVDAPRQAAAMAAPSNVIFLNNCIAPNDCVLRPGGQQNDSRTNTSSIATQNASLSPWRFSIPQWDSLVQCVQQVYAPFNVEIVTTEPAAATEYFEAMVAGTASQLGLSGGIVGVAPFNCNIIHNAITFSFANDYPDLGAANAADLCWTVAQEIAHAFGLQHKYDSRDPMTYLPPPLPLKLFLDDDGPCGTNGARDCTKGDSFEPTGCSGSATINSYREIADIFGAKPGTPPILTLAEPTSDSEVSRGFLVKANASDDVRLRDVTVTVDRVAVGQPLRAGPFDFRTPKTLSAGPHVIEVTATDFYGAQTTQTREVTVKADCTGNATGCDSGELCLDGRCIAGPREAGGLGTRCAGNDGCVSGVCATSGNNKFCVEECAPQADGCPAGFSCLVSGESGVCWPVEDEGGCATGDSRSGLPIALGLGFAALLLVPRRRRGPRA